MKRRSHTPAMAWPYVFVFLGAFLFNAVPFLPAFTVMIFLKVRYGLPMWPVLFIGVAGSVLGRYLLTRYIIPAFFVGKLTSDSVAVSMGRYAAQNIGSPLFPVWALVRQRRFPHIIPRSPGVSVSSGPGAARAMAHPYLPPTNGALTSQRGCPNAAKVPAGSCRLIFRGADA